MLILTRLLEYANILERHSQDFFMLNTYLARAIQVTYISFLNALGLAFCDRELTLFISLSVFLDSGLGEQPYSYIPFDLWIDFHALVRTSSVVSCQQSLACAALCFAGVPKFISSMILSGMSLARDS